MCSLTWAEQCLPQRQIDFWYDQSLSVATSAVIKTLGVYLWKMAVLSLCSVYKGRSKICMNKKFLHNLKEYLSQYILNKVIMCFTNGQSRKKYEVRRSIRRHIYMCICIYFTHTGIIRKLLSSQK